MSNTNNFDLLDLLESVLTSLQENNLTTNDLSKDFILGLALGKCDVLLSSIEAESVLTVLKNTNL